MWGWGCFKDKEGKKFFNPEKSSTNPVKEIKNQRQFPIKISPLLNIVEISSGSSFCLARDSSGFVYSWGISECGEIGREAPTLKKKVKLPDGEDDMVYDLDNILKYHLTPGKMQKKLNKTPSTIPIDNVKSIGSGSYHSFAVVVGNTVFSCGLNNYAQLGLGDTETRYVIIYNHLTSSFIIVITQNHLCMLRLLTVSRSHGFIYIDVYQPCTAHHADNTWSK